MRFAARSRIVARSLAGLLLSWVSEDSVGSLALKVWVSKRAVTAVFFGGAAAVRLARALALLPDRFLLAIP